MYTAMAILGYTEREAWRLTPAWVLRMYAAHKQAQKEKWLELRYYLNASPDELMENADIDDVIPV